MDTLDTAPTRTPLPAAPPRPAGALDLDGKAILVTGATGSFGHAFCRLVLERYRPRRLIVFSRDEAKQYDMQQLLSPTEHRPLRYFIGDVRDVDRLEMAMRQVDIVVHAAAIKQIPAAEYNPFECIRTNIHGAENVVRAALRAGVERVIALSTDKAASPINLYGASKLAADKIFVAGNNLSGEGGPKFSVVRYGNVVGSRGSVIPLFERLIAAGEPALPITDARMTRFWITLRQGAEFVLSSLKMMRGGEIFVPKLPSMRLVDLARSMAPHLPQRMVGIRPGEKLHEVMITEDDARATVELADRYVIQPQFEFWRDAEPAPPETPGTPVPEGFRYSSDTNPNWLNEATLATLLKEPRG
ncbi:MAG: UDP-N-acetylglucosamine 4,6-dehydratase (inverting) [Inquilinus sp.]|nr:UDP-N-acetylglucosamine 4,6-dehydratase (inverting) [Inquilinus sp.]